MSVLTACIPSLKSFIDSLTGSTSGLRIMLPYEYPDVSNGSCRNGVRSAIATIYRGSQPGENTTMVSSDRAARHQQQQRKRSGGCAGDADADGRTESTQDLTEGVIHRSDQFSVTFERISGAWYKSKK